MPMIPKLSPEDTAELLAHNHALQRQMEQMQQLGVILAAMLFKTSGALDINRLAAPGHVPGFVIKAPLFASISQEEINMLETIFPGDKPILAFAQTNIGHETYLTFKMVGEEASAHTEGMTKQ